MAEKKYIEAAALLPLIPHIDGETTIQCVERAIAHIPAADVVEVRHARWVENHCTACGEMPMGEELWDDCEFAPPRFEYFMDYCPSCGAMMDGRKEDEGK